ncbi:MAG: HAD hydrolase-like protein [Fermentimonas sp.]|nr:HAD hydrolase-like protein [Fermentimonas sp.]
MKQKDKIKQRLKSYLEKNDFDVFDLKSVIFDMDGVLYDSMPAHDKSWRETFDELNLEHQPYEFFLQEGRLGKSTINEIFQRNLQRDSTDEEEINIYARKSELFKQYNKGEILPGAKEALNFVKDKGLIPVLVTGSGQPSLLDKLSYHFPGIFTPETMVTAFNVTNGKPHPEPFILGLKKGGNLLPNQAIVIENAPLGIKAAVDAGIFTIAVNTGPLDDDVLIDAGASIVFHSVNELNENFPLILDIINEINHHS